MQHAVRVFAGKALWLVPTLLGVVAGTAAQMTQSELAPWPWLATGMSAGLGLAVLLLLGGPTGWLRRCAMVLAVSIVVFGQVGWRALVFQAQTLEPALEGRDLQLIGVVAAMPQVNQAGLRFPMRVEQARLGGVVVRLPPRIQLGWYAGRLLDSGDEEAGAVAGLPPVRAGERWQMTVRLKAPHGNSNPFGYDHELWMWENDLQANGYVRESASGDAAVRLGQTWRYPVEWARQHVRDRIFSRIDRQRQASWIAALVTGDQNAIERADWDMFRATGVAHLMSISGLHVTMFAWLAATVAGVLWRRSASLCRLYPAPHAALLAGLLLASLYALFSGWGVPARRTIWMLATVGLLRISGRHWPWPLVWLLAAALVLLLDPWSLMQPGFWLSFVAVGVLFATGDTAKPAYGVRARLMMMLREQWVMTLALTPLVLLLFGQVSIVGLVANLLAIPWVTLVVTPLAMAGVVWSPVWDLAAWAVEALALVLQWLAQLAYASLSVAVAPWWFGAAGVLGGTLLVLRLPVPLRLAGAAWLLPVLLWQAPGPPMGQFSLLLVDVGQGNSVLVRTARHAMLYDAGPRYSRDSDAGQRVLVPLLRALDVRLDMLMLSHRDSDHVGGAGAVLAMQPQVILLSSLAPDHALHAAGAGRRCEAGQRWRWDGVDFEVLHPRVNDYALAGKPNTLSCVLRIAAAPGVGRRSASALLAGDIEAAQEARLVRDAAASLASDVLLVPHHGSKTSSTAGFVDAVAPKFALVQSGYRNRFGHPTLDVTDRYLRNGALVHASPQCGAMSWRSDQPAEVDCRRITRRQYWQHIAAP